MVTQEKVSELKKKARLLKPLIRIGKKGLTTELMEEVEKHLKKRKLIKIKLLKSAIEDIEKKELANDIASKTKSKVIEKIGQTLVFYKE